MNEPTKLLICMYFLIFLTIKQSVPTTVMNKITISSSFKTLTMPQRKLILNESQHSPSLCFYNSSGYKCKRIVCSKSGALLQYPYCATYIARTQNYYPLLDVHIFDLIITISHILDLYYFQEISVSSMTTCVVD